MASANTNTHDLSIFTNEEEQPASGYNDFKSSISFKRLITALSYYESLQVSTNKEHHHKLCTFMKETYTQQLMIEDFRHFLKHHDGQLFAIMNHVIADNIIQKCDIKSCNHASRHYRVNEDQDELSANKKLSDDPYFNLYCDTMDSFHYLISHAYEVGMRYNANEEKVSAEEDNKKINECYDALFAQIVELEKSTQAVSKKFDRISTSKKFDIQSGNSQSSAPVDESGITFMDTLIDRLNDVPIKSETLQKLVNYIKAEQFATESLDLDLNDGATAGIQKYVNVIFPAIDDVELILVLYLVSVGTFSIGIPFKYDGNEILSVTPKYEDLQKEIAEYEHIKFKKNYKEEILPKAEEYNKTVIGKTMELNSLICMILYTDFSKHSAQFTATFRKNSPFEPIQATKQRHRNFYWMSKILKEAVNNYGQPSAFLQGPFYCGMSRVMAMPQFAISLQSPTSTSCHIEVAKKFSGDHGLILQISNKGGDAQWVKGLDVSWLSRFKEEDERIWFGDPGVDPLNITSIRIIASKENLELQIQAITALDSILSRALRKDNMVPSDSVYGLIVKELFDYTLLKTEQKFNKYLYDTFNCFIDYKERITIIIDRVNRHIKDKELLNQLFHNIVDIENRDATKWMEESNTQNLIKPRLFDVFVNVKEIYIDAQDQEGFYPFSLLKFLTILEKASISKATILSYSFQIFMSKKLSFNKIEDKYKEKGFKMEFKGHKKLVITNTKITDITVKTSIKLSANFQEKKKIKAPASINNRVHDFFIPKSMQTMKKRLSL